MAEFLLEDILANDPLGLLSEVKAKNRVATEDERLIASFNEINDFIDRHSKEPSKSTDMNERTLFSRLQGLREHPDKISALKPHDRHNLLQEVEINSIDDILNDDAFGLLGNDADSIFELKHVPKYKDIAQADYIALRKPCKEFDKYEVLFKECQTVNKRSYFISTLDDITDDMLQDAQSIGICGATSTPKWLMETIAQELDKRLNNK